ncbi:MAG: hypothetical protein JJV92_04770 [Desulfosarcina sp.]|nr:hypothetical protein [Desulfobacterales bacterium]
MAQQAFKAQHAFDLKYDTLFSKAVEAINLCGFKINRFDQVSGEIEAKASWSWSSFGEIFTVSVTRGGVVTARSEYIERVKGKIVFGAKTQKDVKRFFDNLAILVSTDALPISEVATQSANPKTQAPITHFDWTIVSIDEDKRIEEYLSTETKLIDNSRSSVSVKRSFQISTEWSQSYTIDQEKTIDTGGQLSLGFWSSNIKASAEKAIVTKYSISAGTRRLYTEDVSLDVPGGTKLRVHIKWKRIWQQGFIAYQNTEKRKIEVPYQVVLGVSFDLIQQDE